MQRKIPDYLTCPMSLQIFLHPVTVSSGHVYEKDELILFIQTAKKNNLRVFCPKSRDPIESFSDAWSMKEAVEDFLLNNPDARSEQYQPIHTNLLDEENAKKYLSSKASIEKLATSTPCTTATTFTTATTSTTSTTSIINSTIKSFPISPKSFPISQKSFPISPKTFPVSQKSFPISRQTQNQDIQEIQDNENFARKFMPEKTTSNNTKTYYATTQEKHILPSIREYNDPLKREKQEKLFKENEAALSKAISYKTIHPSDQKECNALIDDIQNLIYALKFEDGPRSKGPDIPAFMVISLALESIPLPWQEIVVSEGPKSQAMYLVLKAAIEAIKQLNPQILNNVKENYIGQFDLVKTMFGGEIPLSQGGYANFAYVVGTITNQPGYHINQILDRVDLLLLNLGEKYPLHCQQNIDQSQSPQKRFGK
jgi:hypothetical protein